MSDENFGINFVNIPIEIFSNKELTATEKILYGYLSIFKKQCCFQSNEALAEALGVNEKTVTNALKHLAELEYIFVEFVNNNNANRRIYVLFDNPKKIKYLIQRGYLESFPQSSKNCVTSSKNCVKSSKNCVSQNGGESSKFCYHKIIKDNKNIGNDEPTVELSAVVSEHRMPNRADYSSDDDWLDARYKANTIKL